MSSTFNEEPNSSWLSPSSGSADVEGINLVQARLENQALRDQIAAQTHLIQLVTHQLATPLTSLSGSIQLLSELDLTPEQRQEFLEVVQQQVQRLQNLLQDLITIRDVETGEVQTRPIKFSIPALMDEVIAAFQSCPTVYQFSPDLPEVWGDRWQVSQVLVNLLSNAVKYSPNDSPIEVGAARLPSGWVEVWVRDHGLGIPLADQPRLFERFYRVKHGDRQHIHGTGLGLSLCKLLVENQGGQLGVDSTHGKGSRFYFTLPTNSDSSTAKGFAG
ncbi:HAMP domain-containing histidine kinase [Leptolyngbya sp. FACHB-36]|uniref:sensor histidine kinase n=1 Tax=Leptolyngbya sp. FACHB-36 TaxID=2692808 RepID=UPI001680EFD4|nr:HAMP domain-containing sensor histidine kinase [Leptolyngbya sp. FACHB-36]MBD2020019.1 HAMP domain-containing histidine kinase [Leptolyngbya sp. FACHB-36]